MELICNPCGEFRWSSEGPVSQIHSPHLHIGAPGIFSHILRSVQILKREWGAESNGKLPRLFIHSKTATLVLEFAVEVLWAELQHCFLRLHVCMYIWGSRSRQHLRSSAPVMNDDWWWPNDIRGPWGPKASRHLSYRWGKTPKKPHLGNLSRPGSNLGMLHDMLACYRLAHSGGRLYYVLSKTTKHFLCNFQHIYNNLIFRLRQNVFF